MSSAREEILARIEKSLGRQGPLKPEQVVPLKKRLATPPVHVRPKLDEDLTAHFISKLEAVHANTRQVSALSEVGGIIVQHLKAQSLPARVIMARDALLREIEWPENLHIEHRAAADGDMVSVTGAFSAVAETGSLVMISRQYTPTTLNFLPEEHIVVVREEQIVPHIEDVWSLVRQECSEIPRSINFITGPSKTADVEQTIHYGAHGPRRLQVIVVSRTT